MAILCFGCNKLRSHSVPLHRHCNIAPIVLCCYSIAMMIITGMEDSLLNLAATVPDVDIPLFLCKEQGVERGRVVQSNTASYASGLSVIVTARSTRELELYGPYSLRSTVGSIQV